MVQSKVGGKTQERFWHTSCKVGYQMSPETLFVHFVDCHITGTQCIVIKAKRLKYCALLVCTDICALY